MTATDDDDDDAMYVTGHSAAVGAPLFDASSSDDDRGEQ
jgi:hypothetical protein